MNRLALLIEAAREAWRSICTQRLRTFLTLSCVAWGGASVVLLSAWGAGVAQMLENGFEKVGKNLLQVSTGKLGESFTPASDRRELVLRTDDSTWVGRRIRNADIVSSNARDFAEVTAGPLSFNLDVHGVEPNSFMLRGVKVKQGRPIRRQDLADVARIAVLGHRARERLLPNRSAIGANVRIDGRAFEVVGVLDRVGTQLWRGGPTEIDDQVWVPLPSFLSSSAAGERESDVIDQLLVRIPERQDQDAAELELRALLSSRLRVPASDKEAIRISSPMDLLKTLPLDEAKILLSSIALMTLMIGAIGVLNLMLESVQERQREIGVRLALGATRRDVLQQIVTEACFLMGLGGGTGVLVGFGLVAALAGIHVPDLIPLPVLELRGVLLAIVSLGIVGIVAGLVPAYRAVRIEPSITLRSE